MTQNYQIDLISEQEAIFEFNDRKFIIQTKYSRVGVSYSHTINLKFEI